MIESAVLHGNVNYSKARKTDYVRAPAGSRVVVVEEGAITSFPSSYVDVLVCSTDS